MTLVVRAGAGQVVAPRFRSLITLQVSHFRQVTSYPYNRIPTTYNLSSPLVLYYPCMRILSIFFVFAFIFAGLRAVPAASARGELVKGSLAAVYYVATDGNRYAFPNERIYASWYADFSGVSTVTDTELASYPLGGNVTYRPGTRLLKLTNDPKVYAVEPGGVLRWVTSETVATSLWGTSWATRVDDLSDSLFGSYVIGEDLDAVRYPEGSLLVDATLGDYFVMEYGWLRAISATAISENGYQLKDAIEIDVSTFDIGTDIVEEETVLSDSASTGLGDDMEEDVVAEGTDANGSIIQGGSDQVLGRVTLSFRTTTTMERVSVLLEAETDADEDADEGGLVQGDGDEQVTPNLTNVRLIDLDGNEPFGAANVSQATSGDDAQDLTMIGSVTFRAGSHTFLLVADVDENTPVGQSYQATFYVTGSVFVVGPEESEYVTPEKLAFAAVDVVAGGLEVTVASGTVDVNAIRGEQDALTAGAFTFTNQTSSAASVTSVTLTAYVDAGEEDDDFMVGSDTDGGSTTLAKQIVSSVSLVRASDGVSVGTCGTIGSDGRVTCTTSGLSVTAGSSTDVEALVFLNSAAPYGEGADRIAFDIAEGDDVVSKLSVSAEAPNGGDAPGIVLTVAQHGTLTVTGSGAPETVVAMSSTDNSVYVLTFEASDTEDIEVDSFSLRVLDPDSLGSLADGRLGYEDATGTEAFIEGQKSSSGILFSSANLTIPAGETLEVTVYADIASDSAGATSGDTLGFTWEDTVFSGHGVLSGVLFDAGDVGDAISISAEDGSTASVRKNLVSVTSLNSSIDTTPSTAGGAEVLRFTLGSTGEGSSQIYTLTFRVDPSDIATTGDDTDLLEYWADVNGDAHDDDDILDLIDLTSNDEVGEGSAGDIDFSLYDYSAATRDTSPAGITTASGDYGLLTIEFATPLTVTSVGRTLSLELDLRGLAADTGSVSVDLLGSSEFVWGDGSNELGASSLTGTGVSGLALSGAEITIE